MRVQTIIVNWNQTDLTLQCLAALRDAGVAEDSIWLVDNGSQPSAAPAIAARFPAVNLVCLAENRGFAGGCNIGANASRDAQTPTDPRSLIPDPRTDDALFLLNNDALVEPDTLHILIAALTADPHLAAVSPKVYYAGTERVIQSTGLRVDQNSGTARMLNSNEPDRGQADLPADREGLFGCAMLIRRSVWAQSGGFWEPFFAYAEETDWCLRVRKAGWRLRYVPQAVVWHCTSSSLGWDSPLKLYLITRNQLFLRRRHRGRGWARWRGLLYAAYLLGRSSLHYARTSQWQRLRAVWLAVGDYARGISGNARTPTLERR